MAATDGGDGTGTGLETGDALTMQQLDKLPTGLEFEDIDQIRNSTRLGFYVDKLAGEKAEVEQVCAVSEVREKQPFSKRKILELILVFAMANKLELDQLKISKSISNKDGVLVFLEVKSPTADGGSKVINYTVEGRHDSNQSRTTSLDQTEYDQDDMPVGGDIVAEYRDGKWVFLA